jgi:flavorubredoxin
MDIFLTSRPGYCCGCKWMVNDNKGNIYSFKLWLKFIPHFGVDKLVADRIKGLDDEGAIIILGNTDLYIIPDHWIRSPGNFQVYDPVSKILYSGDLGASLGQDYEFVSNFAEHIKYGRIS